MSITLEVTLPLNINFQVTKTFEVTEDKLLATVNIQLCCADRSLKKI